MTMKEFLKFVKLNEERITTYLGIFLIAIVSTIVFFHFRGQTGSVPIENGAASTEVSTPAPNAISDNEYQVVPGDNLWNIAERELGDSAKWQEIADINKLTNPGSIEVGQKLTLRSIRPEENTMKDRESYEMPEQNNSSVSSYTVQANDSLWSIAHDAYGDGEKWEGIAKANKLAHPHIIHKGNVLIIPR